MESCAVPCCKNTKKETDAKGLKIEYHNFPDDVKEAAVWLNKMGKNVDIEVSRVCSQHFAEDDYEVDIQNRALGLPEKRILKPTAVPSRLLKIEWYKRTDKLLNKTSPKAKSGGKLTDAQRALKQLSMLQSAKKAPGPKGSSETKGKSTETKKKASPAKKSTRETRAKTSETKKKPAPKTPKKGKATGTKRKASPRKRKVSEEISSEEEEEDWEVLAAKDKEAEKEKAIEIKGKVNGIKAKGSGTRAARSSAAQAKAINKVVTTRLSNKKISSKFKNCHTCLALLRDKRQLIAKIVALETELKHYIKQESNLELLKVVEKHEKGEIIVVKTEVTSESSDDDSDDVMTAEPCEESDIVTVGQGEDSDMMAVEPSADDPNVMNVGHCEDSDADVSAEQVDDPDVMSGDHCEDDDVMSVEHSPIHQSQQ